MSPPPNDLPKRGAQAMTTQRDDGRTLPWRIAQRAVKPYAFFVSFATAIVSWSILVGVAIGQLLNQFPGQLIGVGGFAAVFLLWAGWWLQRDDLLTHGLLLTVGVWSGVWAVIIADTEWLNISGWLAWCWAGASAGAWLLEVFDRERR